MKKIDDQLGGTTPLNIILNFPVKKINNQEDDEFDEWEEENNSDEDKAKYWFTRDKMDKIIKVHDYLDSLPEIGKVLSFGSILRVAEDLNNKELQSLEIAVLYSKIPETIKKEIVSPYISVEKDEARISVRIKDSLKDLKTNSFDKYKEFWDEYGLVLKEGPAEDHENKETIASLMLFASTFLNASSVNQSLDDYVGRMKDDQDKIYFCVADTYEAAVNSPHIEGLKSKGIEVILLTERIDEWLMAGLMEYQGKELVNAAKEDIEKEDTSKKVSEADQDVIEKIKKHLNEKVSDVVISSRLTDSASCIVLPKHEPGAQLRKILEASGQRLGSSNPIFEINIKHKLVKKLKDMKGKQFNAYVDFLYDYAVIAEGGSPQDPSRYLRQLDKYLS